MSNIHDQIEARIRTFVDELNRLVRQAAVDSVRDALGGGHGGGGTVHAAPRRRGRPPKSASAGHGGGGVATHKGGRRSPEQMSRTLGAVRDWVVSHPGQRVEQIGPGLHLKTKDLARPISKLLDSGHLRREGEKRATKYFPGPRASGALPETSGGGRPKGSAKKAGRKAKKSKK